VSLCNSQAASELIRLSARLSLHFGLAVNLRVDLPVIVGCLKLIRLSVHLSLHFGSAVDSPVVCCLKLIRLSERLSYMSRRRSWPFAQQRGSDADKHTPRPGSPTLLMN